MFFLYSLLYTLAFILMSPLFLLRRQKYASGFRERLGNYPKFEHDGRKVIWLHCVSVGETNAARPLVDELLTTFASYRLVISTTTRTGQELASNIFKDKADAVFYFPFDWKFSVRRALRNFQPSVILLMETEIWPRLIAEAKNSGVKVAIVNGRLSERSFRSYLWAKSFVNRVVENVDLALMQGEKDAARIRSLGLAAEKVKATGNLKFDIALNETETDLTEGLRIRFGINGQVPLIIAASTHEPEEKWVLESLEGELGHSVRLMIAPRHPERFDRVASILTGSPYTVVRRSDAPSDSDKTVDVILLDSIGELRAAYPLADIVFVGGSLIPHGGQNVLEPAAAAKAIVTGPYTMNFDAVIKEFLLCKAIIQTPEEEQQFQISERLREAFMMLLENREIRSEFAQNAAAIMGRSNRGAVGKTVESIKLMLDDSTAK